jgi:DNA ligase (NAD+)
VTLHNADEIKRKDIRIGDRVVVEKAGKVIPHVVRVELERRKESERPFRFPRYCPACRGQVERDPGGVYVRCLNPSCPAQLKEHLRYFAHRQAMDIEGLGPALVEQLVDRGLVRSLPDLYRLRPGDLKGLEHIGTRSAEKLCDAIEESKRRGLRRLLTGLGIRHVGERNARLLAERFRELRQLMQASAEEVAGIPGIGPVVGASAFRFFHSAAGRKTIDELDALGLRMTADRAGKVNRTANKLAGKTVVVTGTLSSLKRQEAEELIYGAGGNAVSSVSANTDLVVVGSEPGTKLVRARRLGVKTINEKQFLKLLGFANSTKRARSPVRA